MRIKPKHPSTSSGRTVGWRKLESFQSGIGITTQLMEDAEPLRLRVLAQGRLESDSDLLIDQLRAIDNRRLTDGPQLRCDSELMMRVYAAIRDIMET